MAKLRKRGRIAERVFTPPNWTWNHRKRLGFEGWLSFLTAQLHNVWVPLQILSELHRCSDNTSTCSTDQKLEQKQAKVTMGSLCQQDWTPTWLPTVRMGLADDVFVFRHFRWGWKARSLWPTEVGRFGGGVFSFFISEVVTCHTFDHCEDLRTWSTYIYVYVAVYDFDIFES